MTTENITLTDAAARRIEKILAKDGAKTALRVSVEGGAVPASPTSSIWWMPVSTTISCSKRAMPGC